MNVRSLLLPGCALVLAIFQTTVSAQTPPVINSFSVENPGVFIGGLGKFIYDVTGAADTEIDQGVGAVSGTTTRFSQTREIYVLPRRSTWNFLGDGSDQGASDIVVGNPSYGAGNWKHPGFDDSSWNAGAGELGYGDNPATVVPFVDVDSETAGDQKNATTYYRTKFSISAGEISALKNLFMELRRDDGAIVYLNGVEIARMNVGEGVLEFDTYTDGLGHSVAGGGNETTYFECQLTPGILIAGDNAIAVEIHQANAASSDTRFDLGLFQKATVSSANIFSSGSLWNVIADGSDLGDAAIVYGAAGYDASNWKHPDFDDSPWSVGAGDFGYDTSVIRERTVLRFGADEDNANNDGANKLITTYFRATFNLSSTDFSSVTGAKAHIRADDGAILYLNGVEVARDGMGAGEVTMDTVATGAGVSETAYDEFVIDPSELVSGINTIAVELHQSSVTSSDVSFDMDLVTTDSSDVRATRVARGSTWSYLDDGGASLADTSSDVVVGSAGYDASNWKHPSFDAAGWRAGNGEFGYGDTSLTTGGHLPQTFITELPYGGDPTNKYVTAYFRRDFTVAGGDLADALGARFVAKVDDGAIVYLNGVEIWRSNLPANPDLSAPEPGDSVTGATFANGSVRGDGKNAIVVNFDKNLLNAGANLIAVELHQNSPATSDAVFDMAMEFFTPSAAAVTYTLTATNEFGSTTASSTATSVPVPASPIYLANSNAANVGWDFPEVWSDKMAPHAGDYIAYSEFNSVVRTPLNAGDPAFGGTGLTISGGNAQLFLSHASGTAMVPAITLDGGRIVNGVNRDLAIGGTGNSIVVVSDSTIGVNANSGDMTVSADLSGSGQVRVRNSSSGATIFTGNNAEFSGAWLVQGRFAPSSSTALGSGAITLTDTGVFDPGTDFLVFLPNTLSLTDEATIVLDQAVAFGTGLVTVDGNVVPDGSYSATELEALGFGGEFTDGGGRLFIGSVGPDSDGDGLLDSWELEFFPTIAATDGSGDADGDGQSNAAEYVSKTSPVNPLDVLKISFVTRETGGEVMFIWPSKAGVSYAVRVGDLSTWTVLATGIAGDGGELSYSDNTGGDDDRHYQLIVE